MEESQLYSMTENVKILRISQVYEAKEEMNQRENYDKYLLYERKKFHWFLKRVKEIIGLKDKKNQVFQEFFNKYMEEIKSRLTDCITKSYQRIILDLEMHHQFLTQH